MSMQQIICNNLKRRWDPLFHGTNVRLKARHQTERCASTNRSALGYRGFSSESPKPNVTPQTQKTREVQEDRNRFGQWNTAPAAWHRMLRPSRKYNTAFTFQVAAKRCRNAHGLKSTRGSSYTPFHLGWNRVVLREARVQCHSVFNGKRKQLFSNCFAVNE